jgi:cytochrome b561
MNWLNDERRYGRLSIGLHWLAAILIVGVYAMIELRVLWPKGTPTREGMKSLHFMLGLTVFALVWARLALRMLQPTPRIEPAPPAWQHALASVVHWVLYLFMIGMPLGGWLMLSAAGKPIPYFGLELPSLVAPDKALATQVKEIHETIGKAGYALIGLHAVAALFRHHVLKDDTLTRMLPRRGG